MTYKVVNISNTGTSIRFGADDTDKLAYAARGQPYKYIIFIDIADSNKIKCFDNEGGTIVQTHATDAKIPIQYAIDNADGKPIFIKGGNYNLASGLDLKNTFWTIHGEKGGNDYQQNIGQTVLIKNYTAAAGDIFLDAGGDPFWYGDLRHIVLSGDDEGLGLKYIHNLRTIEDVFIYNFRTGLHITDPVYANAYNLVIENCLDYGLYMINSDTIYFYGGRIKGNGINVYLDDGETCGFYGTDLEHGVNYGVYLNSNTSAAQPNSIFFNDCAFETWSDTLTAVIYDEGRANTYNKCKISSDNTDFTLINVGANARNLVFNNCLFKANTSSTTARITIDSGATGTKFLFCNTHSGGQITSLVFTDGGTDTLCLGNSGTPTLPDKIPSSSALISRPDMAKVGSYYGSGTTAADGILNSRLAQIAVGTGTSSAATDSTGTYRTYDTAATINSLAGHNASATYMNRGNNAYFKTAIYLNSISNVRIFAGLVASSSAPASAADPLNALSGVGLWFDSAVNANWRRLHNDSSGASVSDDTGVAAATATLYPLEIYANASLNKFVFVFNGTSTDISTDIPAGTTNLGFWVYIENTTGASRTMRCYYIVTRTDK